MATPNLAAIFSDHRIAFRVDGRVVQRLAAAANPQEPGGLLEHFAAQLGDVQQLLPAVKPPVRIAMFDNPLGQLRSDPGHVRQQRTAGRVDIDAHRVDARLHFAFQAARSSDWFTSC